MGGHTAGGFSMDAWAPRLLLQAGTGAHTAEFSPISRLGGA